MKELIKQLIIYFQHSLPADVREREMVLPVDSGKVVALSGVRRSGKSSLFLVTINGLIAAGVPRERIMMLNFDDERLHFDGSNLDLILQSYRELYPDENLAEVYIFLDEVQMATDWESFVRRVYETTCRHIFITGSNSRMLSSEIATSLRGRCLQYEVFPLSFREWCTFRDVQPHDYHPQGRARGAAALSEYLTVGGFPEVVLTPKYAARTLQEYFFIMLYKDLMERYGLRNAEPVRYFVRRVMANLTKPTSVNKIFNEMKSAGVPIGKNTVYDLIAQTEAVYLFLSVQRYDRSIVRQSTADRKYYCIDIGLYRALLPSTCADSGKLLENVVFLHLRRTLPLGHTLCYYKGRGECDFVVAIGDEVTALIQVTWEMTDADTRAREVAGIVEAAEATGCSSLTIITADEEGEIDTGSHTIHIVPAWRWLFDSQSEI